MRAFLSIVLFLVACSPTVQIYTESPEQELLIREAGKTIGVKAKLVEAPGRGVVTLEFRTHEGNICGTALEKVIAAEGLRDALENGIVDCTPRAWTCATVTFAGHELGHVIGLLPHVEEDDDEDEDGTPSEPNLMAEAPRDGAQLTDKQRLRVRAMAVVFNEVCR